jgi:hypothetical protein
LGKKAAPTGLSKYTRGVASKRKYQALRLAITAKFFPKPDNLLFDFFTP